MTDHVPSRTSVIRQRLAAFLAILAAVCGQPALGQTPDELVERQLLAAEGRHLIDPAAPGFAATGNELAAAIDIAPALVTSANLSGPSAGAAVFSSLGVIQPKQGDSLAVLASGFAGTSAPEPGTDFSPSGVLYPARRLGVPLRDLACGAEEEASSFSRAGIGNFCQSC